MSSQETRGYIHCQQDYYLNPHLAKAKENGRNKTMKEFRTLISDSK